MKSGCEGQETKAKRVNLPVLENSSPPKTEIRESTIARWRAGSLIVLYLLMIAHIIQWRLMGRTVSPIEPSESMYTLQNGAVNAGFIFFILAILATLVFGRFVCGWGCHIVALQDFCAWLMKKFGLTPRPFRSRLLVFVPLIVALYMFVWPTVARYLVTPANENLFPEFTNHLITTDYWATFPTVAVAIPFLFICGFMTVYFLGSKGFCTYACPYGGFFGLADQIAPGKIRVTDACNQCGHCTAVCTSNVLVHAEVKQYGMVVDPGCMKCMDCVSVCPNDALYFGFGKPAIGVKKSITKNYSLTWPEELFAAIVFFVSFLAVWDAYELVAMLMALGIAAVTTFLAVRSLRLIRSNDLSFYRWNLKSGGVTKRAGWVFLSFALVWVGLNAHTGYVRYHERAATMAFEKIRIPDELALARPNPARWLSATDVDNIQQGRKHFYAASRAGFFVNKKALSKLAWIEYLSGNTEQAVSLLTRSADHQTDEGKALSLYYRGAIQNRLGRYDEALASLDQALAERPDLVTAREEKGEALWQLHRQVEAIEIWKDATRISSGLPLANSMLAGAAAASGKTDETAAYQKQADQYTPNDPLFHWMLGLRLQNVGMNALAEEHFARAIQLNPEFKRARN
ncbi:MAG: tetratricopeptide repeat protein [Acidobacteriota bacterium]